jgi:hypothetical protein
LVVRRLASALAFAALGFWFLLFASASSFFFSGHRIVFIAP